MEIVVAILIGAAAVAVVLYPIIRPVRPRAEAGVDGAVPTPIGGTSGAAQPGARSETDEGTVGSRAPLQAEVASYRRAIRAGTACRRCGLANPPGSRFCAECGRALGAAKERLRRR